MKIRYSEYSPKLKMTTLEVVTQQVFGEGAETNFTGECHILKAKRKGACGLDTISFNPPNICEVGTITSILCMKKQMGKLEFMEPINQLRSSKQNKTKPMQYPCEWGCAKSELQETRFLQRSGSAQSSESSSSACLPGSSK